MAPCKSVAGGPAPLQNGSHAGCVRRARSYPAASASDALPHCRRLVSEIHWPPLTRVLYYWREGFRPTDDRRVRTHVDGCCRSATRAVVRHVGRAVVAATIERPKLAIPLLQQRIPANIWRTEASVKQSPTGTTNKTFSNISRSSKYRRRGWRKPLHKSQR